MMPSLSTQEIRRDANSENKTVWLKIRSNKVLSVEQRNEKVNMDVGRKNFTPVTRTCPHVFGRRMLLTAVLLIM